MDASDFLFYIHQDEDIISVAINSKRLWIEQKAFSYADFDFTDEESEYFEKELEPKLYNLGLQNSMESFYDIVSTPEKVRQMLLNLGMQEDDSFNSSMDEALDG